MKDTLKMIVSIGIKQDREFERTFRAIIDGLDGIFAMDSVVSMNAVIEGKSDGISADEIEDIIVAVSNERNSGEGGSFNGTN